MTILKGFRADFEGNGYITVTKTADYERSISQLRQFKTRKKIRNALEKLYIVIQNTHNDNHTNMCSSCSSGKRIL